MNALSKMLRDDTHTDIIDHRDAQTDQTAQIPHPAAVVLTTLLPASSFPPAPRPVHISGPTLSPTQHMENVNLLNYRTP